jgi:hypothetical protein
MWQEGKHSNDYKLFDKFMSERFTVGGTSILIHKYLGPKENTKVDDATQPKYLNQSEKNIQDLLFLENRDRKYDSSIYSLRGIYQVTDSDFSLEQFGLFLQTGTLFMTFHINDMVAMLGRRIMAGDVLELPHLIDYEALSDVPTALKRFFIVGDCSRASEGFSPTWWPHLWRCKINPLVDSQEYKDIINKIQTTDNNGNDLTLGDLVSTFSKYDAINNAIIEQAEVDVPESGYDTSFIYTKPLDDQGGIGDPGGLDASNMGSIDASSTINKSDRSIVHPDKKVTGYLTQDGKTPNGLPVVSGISFPSEALEGDYCLRVDYSPNRLFRYDGRRWVKIEDALRTNLTPGSSNNATLKNSFRTSSKTIKDQKGNTKSELQNLNEVLKLKPDN